LGKIVQLLSAVFAIASLLFVQNAVLAQSKADEEAVGKLPQEFAMHGPNTTATHWLELWTRKSIL